MPFPFVPLALAGGSALANFLAHKTARSPKVRKLNNYAANQQAAQNAALAQAQQQLANPTAGFEPIAQAARNRFNTQTVPALAARFGLSNSRTSSPAFLQQLSSAGGDLDTNLAAQQAAYGLQQQRLGQGLLDIGLRPQFSYQQDPGGPTALSSAFSGLGQGLGAASGTYLGQHMDEQSQRAQFKRMSDLWKQINGNGAESSEPSFNPSPGTEQPYFGAATTQNAGNPNIGNYAHLLNNGLGSAGFQQPMNPQQGQKNFNQALEGGYGLSPLAQYGPGGNQLANVQYGQPSPNFGSYLPQGDRGLLQGIGAGIQGIGSGIGSIGSAFYNGFKKPRGLGNLTPGFNPGGGY